MNQPIESELLRRETDGKLRDPQQQCLFEMWLQLAHRVGRSSQATPATVDKFQWPSNTIIQTLPVYQSAESRIPSTRFCRRLRTHTLTSQATNMAQRPVPTNVPAGTSSIVGPKAHKFAAPSKAANTTVPIANLMTNCALSPAFSQDA